MIQRACAVIGLAFMVLMVAGCGTPDVTGSSVEDAMKERSTKAENLDKKEGKGPADHSAEMSQDPQAGSGK